MVNGHYIEPSTVYTFGRGSHAHCTSWAQALTHKAFTPRASTLDMSFIYNIEHVFYACFFF